MEKEFIPYDLALVLNELGFDEPCIYVYLDKDDVKMQCGVHNYPKELFPSRILAPLYQQAFRWLYQKLGIEKGVMPLDTETQQLLLKELIDKVSSKHLLT